jgi:uncharacterized protein
VIAPWKWFVVFAFSLSVYTPSLAAQGPDGACLLEQPSFAQKRVCQNTTLHELDRKLERLEAELQNAWHLEGIASYVQSEAWHTGARAACQDDACLQAVYRQRLRDLNSLPSFPCSGRLNPAERAICQTPALGPLDRTLNLEYQMALDASYTTLELQREQWLWLRTVRDQCASAACVTRVYKWRIAYLKRVQAAAIRRATRSQKAANSSDARGQGLNLRFTAAQQRSIQRQINAGSQELGPIQPDCLSKPIDALDLNRDGRPDPVFMTCDGGHNELAFFFLSERDQYRLVLSDWVGYFGYTIQDTRIHGLPVLMLITHGSCCDHGHSYYGYDGHVFKAVACFNEHFINEDVFIFESFKPSQGSC